MDYHLRDTAGKLIDARVEIEPGRVFLHSRSGPSGTRVARNPEYSVALNAILDRLGATDAIEQVLIDSTRAREQVEADRILATGDDFRLYPLAQVRNQIRRQMRKFGRTSDMPANEGNSNKRLRFDTALGQQELVRRLRAVQASPSEAGSQAAALLTIVEDPKLSRALFERWRQALLKDAIREPALWRQPAERFIFRNQSDGASEDLGPRTALGIDPSGENWAVQINEAATAGDQNVISAIAVDDANQPYVLRQGRLNANNLSRHVGFDDFRRFSGLTPVAVTNGNTPLQRDWYIVTRLDLDPAEIRENTSRFIDSCLMARDGVAGRIDPGDAEVIAELCSGDETGGTYTIPARAARDEQTVLRNQGEVWQQMAELLRLRGMTVKKPRHAKGYEVDAEIVNGSRKVLVEIKSTASAADVYGGLGQLLIYGKLFPRLSKHVPILLLPAEPRGPLAEAVRACGVKLCTFEFGGEDSSELALSEEFLRLVG